MHDLMNFSLGLYLARSLPCMAGLLNVPIFTELVYTVALHTERSYLDDTDPNVAIFFAGSACIKANRKKALSSGFRPLELPPIATFQQQPKDQHAFLHQASILRSSRRLVGSHSSRTVCQARDSQEARYWAWT